MEVAGPGLAWIGTDWDRFKMDGMLVGATRYKYLMGITLR